jgi:hypothetical protein
LQRVPLTPDPDPDGYFSYARMLQEEIAIREHRRLPGYPAILAFADALSPDSMLLDAHRLHFFLAGVFGIGMMVGVAGLFGRLVGLLFASILAAPNFLAYALMMPLADLPSVVSTYLAAGLLFASCRGRGAKRWLYCLLFAAAAFASELIHPAMSRRLLIFAFAAFAVWLARDRLASAGELVLTRYRLATLTIVALVALLANAAALHWFTKHVPMPYMEQARAEASTTNFLAHWKNFRGIMCMPPAGGDDLSLGIERVKDAVSLDQGYRVERTAPPGVHPRFREFFENHRVPVDEWIRRLHAHPVDFATCAASEWRAKYHTILRHLTPFAPDLRDWITVRYPPDSGSLRDRLFWRYGVNLLLDLPADSPELDVVGRSLYELARIALVLTMLVAGIVMLDRRFPSYGLIFAVGTLAWMAAGSILLPLETRYLMPMIPVVYVCYALSLAGAIHFLLRTGCSAMQRRHSRQSTEAK